MPEFSPFDHEFLRNLLSLAAKEPVHRLLFVTDQPLTASDLRGRKIREKLVYAVPSEKLTERLKKAGFAAVTIPPYEFARVEKVKVAVVAAMSAGIVEDGEMVLCAVAKTGTRNVDTVVKLKIGQGLDEQTPIETLDLPSAFNGQVVQAIASLALAVGHQGYEGHPVGTIFVVGDSERVLERSRQLTINPFQGLPEADRNIQDPRIREALKNFSVLDGAFVIREDGTVLAGGRYLQAVSSRDVLPLGLGARHASAAAMTQSTGALAVTVSQSTGTVRLFKDGEVILELPQVSRRMAMRF